jgi:hypothetical protein
LRGLVSIAVLVFVAALTPVAVYSFSKLSPAYAGTAAATATTPSCVTPKVVIWLDTEGSGVAGSIYYDLEFTNLSGHTCTILGYPGVSAVGLNGHQLGSGASDNASHKPFAVTIPNGSTGAALLQIVDVSHFSTSTCHPQTAAGLRVLLPHETGSKIVPFPFSACSSTKPSYLTVQAVQKT